MQDLKSSNGTMVFLQSPMKLHYNRTTVLRMGRTTLSLQAKRSWSAALRGITLFDTKSSRQSQSLVSEIHTQICDNVMSKEGTYVFTTVHYMCLDCILLTTHT
jgi:hypothetical protein